MSQVSPLAERLSRSAISPVSISLLHSTFDKGREREREREGVFGKDQEEILQNYIYIRFDLYKMYVWKNLGD